MCGGKTRAVRVVAIFAGLLLMIAELSAQYPYPPQAAQLPMVVQAPMLPSAANSMTAVPRVVPRERRSSLGLLTGFLTSKTHSAIKQVNGISPIPLSNSARPQPGWAGGASEVAGCGSCGELACVGGCGASSCSQRVRLYGEYLYLRPRNAEVPYAVPIDGAIAPVLGNGIQIGPTALVDTDYESGFRAGFSLALNDGAQIGARFTNFESRTSDQAFIQPPDVLRSLVTHPLGNNVAADSLRASARYDIDFELVDVTYQAHWKCTERMTLDYVLGIRYGELGQEFRSQFDTNGTTFVGTNVDFDGAGPRIGLDFQRTVGQMGLFLYSRGDANFLAGKSRARYNQSDAFAGTVVDTGWESGRIVSQLDFELGFGWSDGKAIHFSTGYLISSWFNAVRTDEFIQSVQANQFGGLGDGITFDGLVVHGELRF